VSSAVLFSGTAHPSMAASIATHAKICLGTCAIDRFPDGEMSVRLLEPVRRREVFLVQPLSPPVNDHLVELLILADACRRAAARCLTAVIPYLGYSRADKRHGCREAISSSMVADLLQAVGIGHVVTMDLHAPQIEGFFHVPVDSLTAVPTLCETIRPQIPQGLVVVAPDAGRVKMATEYAHRFDAPVVVLHKRRAGGAETAVTHLVGDVRDKSCLIIDDMISTGDTIAQATEALRKAGAHPDITVAATHGLLLPAARERLNEVGIDKIFVTDTLRVSQGEWPQLQVVSVAPVFAAALQRFMVDGSLGDLF
jgi:ribose-phosphate pyrophosphokinase